MPRGRTTRRTARRGSRRTKRNEGELASRSRGRTVRRGRTTHKGRTARKSSRRNVIAARSTRRKNQRGGGTLTLDEINDKLNIIIDLLSGNTYGHRGVPDKEWSYSGWDYVRDVLGIHPKEEDEVLAPNQYYINAQEDQDDINDQVDQDDINDKDAGLFFKAGSLRHGWTDEGR